MTSGSQAELDYGRKERVARRLRLSLRAVKDAVDAIGLNVAAAACGCTTSELCGALKGRKHRPLRLEWLIAICDVARPDFREQILETLLAPLGFKVAPAKDLSPEERLARLELRLAARFGAAGAELVEENRR